VSIFNRFSQATTSRVASIDIAEAKRRQDAGALLIDVREPEEWRDGHAPHARHIPLGDLVSRSNELPKDRELLMICRSGRRSSQAQRLLSESGFTQVRNVSGGMTAWSSAGLSLIR